MIETMMQSISVSDVGRKDILKYYRKNKAHGTTYRDLINAFVKKYFGCDGSPTISEYDIDCDYYIDIKKYHNIIYQPEDYKIFSQTLNIEQIVQRERLFRSDEYSYQESTNLIYACAKFFIEFFKENDVKVIVGQPIDNYVMDVMVRIAKYYDVQFIGLVRFFYNGYVRVTTYGEYNFVRQPESIEVESVLRKLASKQKTIFVTSKKDVLWSSLKYYFVYKIKYALHYLFYVKVLGRLEYDYVSTRAQVYPKSLKNIIRSLGFFESEARIKKVNKSIYIPLHYFPEATVEYWVEDLGLCTYYNSLYRVVSMLVDSGFVVYVKEHPAIFLKRDVKLLQPLRDMKNVVLLSPFISTHELLSIVDDVLVWSGTTGIESFVNDKNVVSLCENYYNEDCRLSLQEFIKGKRLTLSDTQKYKLIERVLSNCLPI